MAKIWWILARRSKSLQTASPSDFLFERFQLSSRRANARSTAPDRRDGRDRCRRFLPCRRSSRFAPRSKRSCARRAKGRVIYIPGNHDDFLAGHLGAYGAITIQKHAIHVTADGRRIFVMHGHELDTVVQNMKWLALLGDLGYQFLLALNPSVNLVRRLFGFAYWSLSKAVKKRVKDAVTYIGAYEKRIVRYAGKFNAQGVLCGHIHTPAIRQMGALTYDNCGDWVENFSVLVEHGDGRMELLANLQTPERERIELLPPLPVARSRFNSSSA